MIIDSLAALTNHPSFTPSRARRLRSRLRVALGAVLAAGAVVTGVHLLQAQDAAALVPPVAVTALEEGSLTAVRGQVAEVFGNKFILSDASGRALIETGRAGEGGGLIIQDETVTVQGRFKHGFLHAEVLLHDDGRVDELHPPHPSHGPKHGPHGPAEHDAARPAPGDAPAPRR